MQRPPTWKKRQELRTGAERKKQERAAFSKTSHIEAKAGRDSVMWSFIHSPSWSFNSYCLSTPCQTQLGDADRETNKGTRESGEGSPGEPPCTPGRVCSLPLWPHCLAPVLPFLGCGEPRARPEPEEGRVREFQSREGQWASP